MPLKKRCSDVFCYSLITTIVLSLQVRNGMAQWSDGRDKPQPIKLILSEDSLMIQREEMVYTQADSENMEQSLLSKVGQYQVHIDSVTFPVPPISVTLVPNSLYPSLV